MISLISIYDVLIIYIRTLYNVKQNISFKNTLSALSA